MRDSEVGRLLPSGSLCPDANDSWSRSVGFRAVLACSVFVLGTGCVSLPVSTIDKTPPALYASAEEAYLLGQLSEARDAFRRFAETSPNSPFRPWAYYWRCRIDLNSARLSRAMWNLKRALDLRPEPVLRAQALMAMGDVEYNRRRYHDALRWYRRVGHEGLETSVRQDELLFKTGMVLMRTNNAREADRCFARIEQYAGSPFLEEARRRRSSGGVLVRHGSHILVKVYPHFARAEALARELGDEGFYATVERLETPAGDRYAVRVPLDSTGPGTTGNTTAVTLLRELEAKGFRPKLIP